MKKVKKSIENIIRVVLYIRVSSEEQVKHGYSLQAQRERLIDYCKQKGYQVVEIYVDEGKSARSKLRNRTELLRLIDDAKQGKFDRIVFWRLDRWFRNIADYYKVQEVLEANKIDLQDTYKQIQELYASIGYKTIITSAKQGIGIDEIKLELKGKISVFSGNSGVGKSSIINALFGAYKTQEGEISAKNKKGKNTTTDTKLYELEENTYIADTPGFSSFEISEIETTELDKYFREFCTEIAKCEFVGCTHIKEQECGIKKAVEEKTISEERYERFCKIYEELKDKEKHRW